MIGTIKALKCFRTLRDAAEKVLLWHGMRFTEVTFKWTIYPSVRFGHKMCVLFDLTEFLREMNGQCLDPLE